MNVQTANPIVNSTYAATVGNDPYTTEGTKGTAEVVNSSKKPVREQRVEDSKATADVAVVLERSSEEESINGLYTAKGVKANATATGDYVDKVAKALSLDSTEKNAFKKTWNYLRSTMGLTKQQAAGVCGNIFAESHFSPDNAQDSSYPGRHNTDYKYAIRDGVGYGLLQWTYYSRKQGLKDMATNMKSSVSNVDVQLAYFKKEMTSDFKTAWNKIKKSTTVKDACDIFLKDVEKPAKLNYSTRESYANTIYNCVK